jgi:hypothetical protein
VDSATNSRRDRPVDPPRVRARGFYEGLKLLVRGAPLAARLCPAQDEVAWSLRHTLAAVHAEGGRLDDAIASHLALVNQSKGHPFGADLAYVGGVIAERLGFRAAARAQLERARDLGADVPRSSGTLAVRKLEAWDAGAQR